MSEYGAPWRVGQSSLRVATPVIYSAPQYRDAEINDPATAAQWSHRVMPAPSVGDPAHCSPAHFQSWGVTARTKMPAGLPCWSNTRSIPASSIALLRASTLFGMGVRLPVSKSRTVLSDTLALIPSSVCDQPNHPRAARLCSGVSVACAIFGVIHKNR